MPLTPTLALVFADRWYAAWNAHDIDAIMACYDPQIRHSSPFIKKYNNSDAPALEGLDAVQNYFARALERNPHLRFEPKHLATGQESVILLYRRHSTGIANPTPPEGELSAEVFFLTRDGKILRSVSHYG
jgi:hypothetical protein